MCNPDGDRNVIRLLCFGLLLSLSFGAANAAPLHWQLNGVTFSDGGKAFGGFDFDAGTKTYSNINITTTTGSLVQGSYYSSVAPFPNSVAADYLYSVSTVPVFSGSTASLALSFTPALLAAGGTASFSGAAVESVCANADCSTSTPQRTITGGTVSAVSAHVAKRWYLKGVILSDGAQVFGSFLFDANSGTYSAISVTTSATQAILGASYNDQSPAAASSSSIVLVSAAVIVPSSTTTIAINFATPLTNSGGTIAITTVTEGTCTSATCNTSNTVRTVAVGGFVSTTQETGATAILPQIADGGGFVTEFIITNPTGATITCRLTFWKDSGVPLLLTLNGAGPNSTYVVRVPGHSTQFLATQGAGATVTGWGLAENVAQLGVIAAFRLKLPNITESEATVQGIPPTAGFAMAFDETPGFDTGFALANVSAFDTVIENLYFYDTTGALIFSDSSKTLGPHQHESFMFSSRYNAQLQGKRGTVRVYYGVQGTPTNGTVGLSGLGLRVNPGGTFTSLATTSIN